MMQVRQDRCILVSAYGCEPFRGSEAGVGWNWVMQLASFNTVHVITRANNKRVIEENIPKDLVGFVHFYYYDAHRYILKLKKRDKGLYLYNICWQIGIIKVIKQLKKKIKFDYTMHLSFGSLWMPTFLPFFDIPFIWGPLGGGDCVPKAFLSEFPLSQRIIQKARYWLNATSFINPLIAFPCRRAVLILARTINTAEVIPKIYKTKVKVILETAMEKEIFMFERKRKFKEDGIVKLITTGRLVPFKNIISAVRALKYINNCEEVLLTIIGSGSEKNRIEKEIALYSLQGKVRLIDEIPRKDVLEELQNSDIFIFPSLREAGTWALMEAMALGLPVICLNWTGMNIITDDNSAFRLNVSDPIRFPIDIGVSINKLLQDPRYAENMGKNGRERIRLFFNWKSKGDFMNKAFGEIEKK